MTEIFHAGGQLWKVRLWMWISLAIWAVALWFAWELFVSYGTRPADGGVLAPLPVRLAWAGTIAGFGFLFVLGMRLYGGLYVANMVFDERSETLHLRTLSFLGNRDRAFPASAIERGDFHHGFFWAGGVTVDAPWHSLRIRGRRWPFIVDAQGEFLNEPLARRLFGGEGTE
jgi:hypothetical protein